VAHNTRVARVSLHGRRPSASAAGIARRVGVPVLYSLLLPLLVTCVRVAHGSVPSAAPAGRGLLPFFSPMASGPYPVGAVAYAFLQRSVTTGELRRIDSVIWYPAAEIAWQRPSDPALFAVPGVTVAHGRFPVVVFSHAAASSPVQSAFLTAHLASHGFVVAAPSHPGSTFDDCLGCGSAERMRALLEDSAANRPAEVSAMLDVLAALDADPTSLLYEAVDTERAAVIGHSWGGYTAIVAATRDQRFRAAVAMAPVVNATLEQAERALRVPVMVMGSRLDDVTPFPPQERLFKALPSGIPRYLVAFPRGGHTAYSGLCPADSPGCRAGELGQERAHALVGAYVTAFLRRYLLADGRYESLLDRSMGGGDVEFTARVPQEP